MSGPVEDEYGSRVHEQAEEDGEPWLVSYADMMTLLFGFFVLMYSFSSAKVDATSEDWIKVKREVAAFFGRPQASDGKDDKENNGAGDSFDRGSYGHKSLSDVPVVPFESKFRYLATRDEMIDEVTALLRTLTERTAGATSIEDRRALTEVRVMQAMLQGLGAQETGVVSPSEGKEPDASGQGKDKVGTGSSSDNAVADDLARTGQEISLIMDSRNLLKLSKESIAFTISDAGSAFLNELTNRLLNLKRPMHITTEARQRWTGPGKPGPADRSRALAETSRKAVVITETLQTLLNQKSKQAGLGESPHIFSVAGLGYFSGRGEASEMDESIIFRVNLLRTENARREATEP
jgi:flagellar motor protein MotB